MSFKVDSKLQSIINDKKSGSRELLNSLVKYFYYNVESLDINPELLEFLKERFNNFTTITNFLSHLESICDDKTRLQNFLKKKLSSDKKVIENIFKDSLPYLSDKKKIITLSNSSTLRNLFSYYSDYNLKFFVCESRPKFEGRTFARNLSSYGFEVKIITDAMMAEHVKLSDAAVIGADQILADGSVVNKVGSLQLAIICKHFGKPLFVIADKTKKTRKKSFIKDNQPAKEIISNISELIEVENYYFERINNNLITRVITD